MVDAELDRMIRLMLYVVGILRTVAIVGNFEVSRLAAAVEWVDPNQESERRIPDGREEDRHLLSHLGNWARPLQV
jgi:hypothetical protein